VHPHYFCILTEEELREFFIHFFRFVCKIDLASCKKAPILRLKKRQAICGTQIQNRVVSLPMSSAARKMLAKKIDEQQTQKNGETCSR
jgi:hypothetical protein